MKNELTRQEPHEAVKICAICKEAKPLKEFPSRSGRRAGRTRRRGTCRACRVEENRRAAAPAKARESAASRANKAEVEANEVKAIEAGASGARTNKPNEAKAAGAKADQAGAKASGAQANKDEANNGKSTEIEGAKTKETAVAEAVVTPGKGAAANRPAGQASVAALPVSAERDDEAKGPADRAGRKRKRRRRRRATGDAAPTHAPAHATAHAPTHAGAAGMASATGSAAQSPAKPAEKADPPEAPAARAVENGRAAEENAVVNDAAAKESPPAPKKKRQRRRKRGQAAKPSVPLVAASAAIPVKAAATDIRKGEFRKAGELLKETDLRPTRQGIVRMRGKTDNGRKWYQEVDLELAKTLVREHAAVVVNRNTIRRIYGNKEFRRMILNRDNYKCYFCGKYGDTIDHLLPRAKGGHTTPANCVCACNECNQSKAARDLHEFIGSLE